MDTGETRQLEAAAVTPSAAVPDTSPQGQWMTPQAGNTTCVNMDHLAHVPIFQPANPNMDALSQPLHLSFNNFRVTLPALPTPLLLSETEIPFPQRLALCIDTWKEILPLVTTPACTAWILDGIQNGFRLQHDLTERFDRPNAQSAYNNFDQVTEAMDKYLARGIYSEIKREEAKGIMALSWANERLVTDGGPFNDHSPIPEKFKYEDLRHAATHVRWDSWMTKADARLLYLCVPLHISTSAWCCVRWKSRIFRCNGTPLGLSPAPRLATMVMRPLIAVLRRLAIAVSQYLDDGLVSAPTSMAATRSMATYAQVLTRAGLLLHPRKCVIQPVQEITFLGFVIKTAHNRATDPANELPPVPTVTMVPAKRHQIVQQARKLMSANEPVQVKKMARWTGTVVACYAAVLPALILLTKAHAAVAEAVQANGWRRGTIEMTSELREEIRAVRRLFAADLWTDRPLWVPDAPTIVLTTDASNFAWGAFVSTPTDLETPTADVAQAQWTRPGEQALPSFRQVLATVADVTQQPTPQWMSHAAPILDRALQPAAIIDGQTPPHNNILEARAVLMAVIHYAPRLAHQLLLVRSDNTTTIAALTRATSRNRQVAVIAVLVHVALLAAGARLVGATHLAGLLNDTADQASRTWLAANKHLEWPLDNTIFHQLLRRWMHKDQHDSMIDCFATAANTKCRQFFCLHPCPLAAGTDGLRQVWKDRHVYVNPPFHLWPRVTDKILSERPRLALCIVPDWPNQLWYQRLAAQAIDRARVPTTALRGPNAIEKAEVLRNPRWTISAMLIVNTGKNQS